MDEFEEARELIQSLHKTQDIIEKAKAKVSELDTIINNAQSLKLELIKELSRGEYNRTSEIEEEPLKNIQKSEETTVKEVKIDIEHNEELEDIDLIHEDESEDFDLWRDNDSPFDQ